MKKQIFKPESFPFIFDTKTPVGSAYLIVDEINPLSEFFQNQKLRKNAKLENGSNKKFKEWWDKAPTDLRMVAVRKFVEYLFKQRVGEMSTIDGFPGKRYFFQCYFDFANEVINILTAKHHNYHDKMLKAGYYAQLSYVGVQLISKEGGEIEASRSIFIIYGHENSDACTLEYKPVRDAIVIHQDKIPYECDYFLAEIKTLN